MQHGCNDDGGERGLRDISKQRGQQYQSEEAKDGRDKIGDLAAGHDITGDPRPAVTKYVALHQIDEETFPSLAALMREIANQVMEYGTLGKIPAAVVRNTRNDMYLASEAIRFLMKDKEADLSKEDVATLNAYKGYLDNATKFIPFWVKLAVAIALGLGTMIGWKRIVVTVGEKIGKTHLSYGQGAAAELVAAGTIFAADHYGLPVSTTHVLSSGVAGTMAANGSGLQMSTLRNIALAWVLTLPSAMMLSAFLYWVFSHLF
jgi:inorganic phosphate transporter, PiT family